MQVFVLQCKAQAIFWVIFFVRRLFCRIIQSHWQSLSEELRHVTTKIILSRKLRLPSSRCRSRWSRAATWRSKEPWRTRWPPTWTCRTRLASTSPSRSWRMPPKVKYSWVKPKLVLVKLTWLFRSHCFYNGPSSILRDVPEIPCVPDIFLLNRFDLS